MSQDNYNYQGPFEQNQFNSNTPYQEYQPNYTNQQPSYSYRDPSLYPTPEMLPAIMDRRQRFRRLRTFIQIGFVLLPFVGAWILASHFAATYNTYKQGSCTINSKDVKEVVSRDKHNHVTSRTYYPRLYYDVHTVNETQASAVGYDGPTARSYSSYREAQTVVDQYEVGQNVPCWYNPVAPDKAFLVFYGFTSLDWGRILSWGIGGFGAFALTIYLLFDWTIWRLFALQKRGVVTQGRVTEVKRRRNRSRKIEFTSIINFRALEESGRMRTINVKGDLGVGRIMPVCYDPLFPRYRRNGVWPNLSGPGAGVMAIVVLTFIGLVILYIVWLIP